MIAATALYIASKQQDEPVKIRDLINVVHRTLNRDPEILDLSEEYWNYRDSIVQAELLTMRMINFKTINPDIHLVCLSYSELTPNLCYNKNCFVPVYVELFEDAVILDLSSCVGEIPISQTVLDSFARFPPL